MRITVIHLNNSKVVLFDRFGGSMSAVTSLKAPHVGRTLHRTLHHYTARTAPGHVFMLEFVLQISRDTGAT